MISALIGILLGVFCFIIGLFYKATENMKPAVVCFAIAITSVATGVGLYPITDVWQRDLSGQAQLKEAAWNRQILIEEAQAKHEASKSWAKAEIERARGSAEANEILRVSLSGKGSGAYLRWLFIDQLDKIENQIIYLPTEAGVPVLEAGKR